MTIRSGDELGSYVIIRVIGRGGMGVVYLARDKELERDVALKVLPPEFADDAGGLARFQQEARLLAALNHPNILSVFDVGRSGGTSYFVMELLHGRTLRERFDGRAVPWRKAVELVAGLADGLAAAHARGVTHRDLKPDNVFLTDDGVVKILDFGLARPADELASPDTEPLTRAGQILGTPGYMAPEQVRGDGTDARCDIFALGCVLHELLTGTRVFRRDSTAETLAALLHDEPPSLLDGPWTVPGELDRVVGRCLEKDPQHRFQSARDLGFTLKGLLSTETTPAGLTSTARATPSEGTPSIAVLPFASMSGDPENEFFSDGVSEEIINALARLPELQVVGRTSAFSFKGKNDDLRTIGEKLNVRTVLEGSVRKAGGRVRVTAQLVNTEDGYQLWSERFDRNLEDIFEVQDEIARAIAEKLQVTLGRHSERRLVESQTENPEAYQSYVKGRALLLKRGPIVWRALEAFRTATVLDPGYAQAWAGLADAYAVIAYHGMLPPREAMGAAESAVQKAMELGPQLAESHNAAAIVNHLWKWDWDSAEKHYRRSLELNPRYIQGRCWFGFFFLQLLRGRHEEALTECRRALADDPLSAYAHAILAFTLGIAGHGDEAVATARTAVEYDSNAFVCQWCLQSCFVFSGRFEESIVQGELVLARFGRQVWAVYMQALALAQTGAMDEAAALYRELLDRAQLEYVQPTPLAMAAAILGDVDDSFRHIERALEERDPYLVFQVRPWPNGARLHGDARWLDVLRRMGLPTRAAVT